MHFFYCYLFSVLLCYPFILLFISLPHRHLTKAVIIIYEILLSNVKEKKYCEKKMMLYCKPGEEMIDGFFLQSVAQFSQQESNL